MDKEKAYTLVVFATFVTLGSTSANLIKKPENQKEELKAHRVIAGGFFAMTFCAALVELDPIVGVGFATLVAGGAFFNYGLPVLEESFSTEKEKKKAKKR